MKKILIIIAIFLIILLSIINTAYIFNTIKKDKNDNLKIELKQIDKGNYTFIYKAEEYKVIYKNNTWKIINSYKIKDKEDIAIICKELIKEHPIKSKDRKGYRTIDDLVYEWLQHNILYEILPDDSKWKNHAKDVDLDPDDQGKTFKELYETRINKK